MESNLNGSLLISMMLVVLIGVAGKLIEAIHLQKANHAAREEHSGRRAPLHNLWLRLHMLAAAVLVALLAFHILSVYYF